MFYQGSLFGATAPVVDAEVVVDRIELDAECWVDYGVEWLAGADTLFDQLVDRLPFRQRTAVPMYDRLVDEPRLTTWWRLESGEPEPLPVLRELRRSLSSRYGEGFDSIGFNLYRDGADSVAWHGDRHRHVCVDPVVAIVSLGARRPFRLRPRGGGPALSWSLGHGDLLVMGGACQHDWEHTVPKVRHAEPRLSVTFRSA